MAFELKDLFRDVRQAKNQAAVTARRQAGFDELLGSESGGGPADFQPGSGLLSNPSDIENQLTFASGIEALNPGSGSGLLGQILGEEGLDRRQAMAVAQRAEASVLGAETDLSIADQRAAAAQANSNRDFAVTQGREARQVAAEERAIAKDTRQQAQDRLTQPFQAFNPLDLDGPGGGATLVEPLKQHKQQSDLDLTSGMAGDINSALGIIDQFGSELLNQEAVGKLATIHSGLLLRASQARGAGAPQAAEMEINMKALPDPNSFGARLNPLDKTRILSAYGQFGQEIKQNVFNQVRANPTLTADFGVLGPEFLESRGFGPDMMELVNANRGMRMDELLGQ